MHLRGPLGSVCANEMGFEATVRKHTFSNCQKAGKLLQGGERLKFAPEH